MISKPKSNVSLKIDLTAYIGSEQFRNICVISITIER
jgi:hypothetical protein